MSSHNILDFIPSDGSVTYTDRIIRGEDNLGNKTVNQYSILNDLGEGSFGLVQLALQNET
jgi:hypothetical protein